MIFYLLMLYSWLTLPKDTAESVFIGMLGFGLTIIFKKTKILSQWTNILSSIKINCKDIENVDNFVYLGLNVASNASLDK